MVGVSGDSAGAGVEVADKLVGEGKDRVGEGKDRVVKVKRKQFGVVLKDLLPDLVNVMGGARGSVKRGKNRSYDIALIVNWSSIVGVDFAADLLPLSISRSVRGSILVVSCREGRELFMSYRSEQICERINSYFGFVLVDSLRFDKRSIEVRQAVLESESAIAIVARDDFSERLEIYGKLRNLLLHL